VVYDDCKTVEVLGRGEGEWEKKGRGWAEMRHTYCKLTESGPGCDIAVTFANGFCHGLSQDVEGV
jgi:hypothetical protein